MSSSAIGLARLPRALRDLLDEQAHTLSAAATALETLTRDPSRAAAIAEIVRLEDEGDRVTHDIQHALPTARIASPERGELLRLTQTLDDIVDLIEHVAHELPHLTAVLPHDSVARAGATLRDLVRTTSTAVERIEHPPAAREPLRARAHELANELRAELRAAYHTLVETHDDVLPNVRAGALLRHLREIGHACTRALLAVEMQAGTHP
jgi:uncharacterized protein Yka (UPF0111/DUF47 family)